MTKSSDKTKITRAHPLVGTWVSVDEYETDVEYIISPHGKGFRVRAVNAYDGERADVFEIKWDGEALTFATHWNSTGRFARCRLLAVSKTQVDFTHTYTDQELLRRKSQA